MRRYIIAAAVILTFFVGASLAWNIHNEHQQIRDLVVQVARSSFNKDQAFRLWGTRHGGIYVRADERTPPNPLLEHMPDRDVVVEDGTLLTLMDPATMLRQVMTEFPDLYGIKGRIVSMVPLNPANLPTEWEEGALDAFARGEKEAFEFTGEGASAALRLMRPMFTLKPCLSCHGVQGFQDGDLHGGVGVIVHMTPYLEAEAQVRRTLSTTHGIIWLLGLGAIAFGGWHGRRRVEEQREAERELEVQATHDALTGLPNRVLFADHLGMAQAGADRRGDNVAVHFLDLDFFKDVNDSEGHGVGDVLLQEVGERLGEVVRKTDTVARLGGDEFAVVQNEVASADDALTLAEKMQDLIKEPFRVAGKEFHIGASIGITLYPRDTSDPEDLLRYADMAMYAAKNRGRNTIEFYSAELTNDVSRRRRLEQQLREALEKKEFFLQYQPKVLAEDGRIVGAEALVRWKRQGGEVVSPAEFIPVAERSGLIVPLGKWVLAEACRQAKAWSEEGLPPVTLAVNLSAVQFRQKDLLEQVAGVLGASGIDPRSLELEVTESVAMQDAEETARTLDALARLGVQLALDDFGTGYSSLSYLKSFPLDRVKIDRSFVRDIMTDPNDAAIVEAT